MMLIACDGDEISVAMARMKLFTQVRWRDPSALRTFGPNSFRALRAETTQFTTSRSVTKETPPEAGAPTASTTILLPRGTGDAPQGGAHRWELHVEPLLNAERGILFACPGMPEMLTRQ